MSKKGKLIMLNNQGVRELAYVTTIDEIRPIPNYDRVEQARVGGWWVIVRKDQFQVGMPAIYIEVDSKTPETKPFEFLESKHYKIKTQKMCKVVSQGLLMSAEDFGWFVGGNTIEHIVYIQDSNGVRHIANDKDSMFVTELLGITYAVQEDNQRKSTATKRDDYDRMAKRHGKLFSHQPFKWLMKREWGKKLLFLILGSKKDKDKGFPSHLPFITKSDEERCLIGQTKIMTNQGPIQISKIVNQKLPVLVKGVNKNGEIGYYPILDYQKFTNKDELLTIEYPYQPGANRTNKIVVTPDHRIYTQRGYIPAGELTLDDRVYTPVLCYNEDVLPAIYGMLLGDGHIAIDKRTNNKIMIVATQGEKQLEYLRFKQSLFADGDGKIVNAGIGSYGKVPSYHYSLETDAMIDYWVKKEWLQGSKKTVTKDVINRLTPESLAFWYMDDGSLSHRDSKTQRSSIVLNTQGFTKIEVDLLVDCLQQKFQVSCHAREDGQSKNKQWWVIYIDVNGTQTFLNLVSPYLTKSMAYKTTPDLEAIIETKVSKFVKMEQIFPIPILSITRGQNKFKNITQRPQFVYDIEVKDVHNFFADSILTHNCENMPWILENKTPFIKTTKIDGTSSLYCLTRKKGILDREEYYVCSRNVRQLTPDQKCYHESNVYWEVDKKFSIYACLKDLLNKHPEWDYVAIQGETAGISDETKTAIQGNPHKFNELRFFCYNFIDSQKGRWNSVEGRDLLAGYGIEWVPIVDDNYILPDDFEEFKLSADGNCEANGSTGLREGYVYRNVENPMLSFKNVSRKYLLNH